MNKSTWKRKEFELVIRQLHSENSSGVLLSGEFGVGKSEMIRNLLASGELDLPVIRLICSAALTDLRYGALAPLLCELDEKPSDVNVIREALAVIKKHFQEDASYKQVLILVEEAQYIDSASGFVLGQLVRSGSAKLLVLSNEERRDSLPLEALVSVARLDRIRIDTLNVDEVANYCGAYLGGRLSYGAAMIIHCATAGILLLVRSFVDTAQRHKALVKSRGVWVLGQNELSLDEYAVEDISQFAHRQHPELLAAMELLSLSGPLSLSQLKSMGMFDVLQKHPTVLIRINSEKAWLVSNYVADGLRLGLLPSRKTIIFERLMTDLACDIPLSSELAKTVLNLGRQLSVDHFEEIILAILESHQYSLAFTLIEHQKDFGKQSIFVHKVRALFGQGLFHKAAALTILVRPRRSEACASVKHNINCVQRWNQTGGAYPQIMSIPEAIYELDQLGIVESGLKQSNFWYDCRVMGDIQSARLAFHKGRLSHAVEISSRAIQKEQLLAPGCNYRLSQLVVLVSALTASGSYRRAMESINEFSMADAFEVRRCYGTVQVLRALVLFHQGMLRESRWYLTEADAELSLYDPEGMQTLCRVLSYVGEDSAIIEKDSGNQREEGASTSQLESTLRRDPPYSTFYWMNEYQLLGSQIEQLQAESLSISMLEEILDRSLDLGIVMRDALHYYIWNYCSDERLRNRIAEFYANLVVPGDCKIVRIHQQFIQYVTDDDVVQMEQFAEDLYMGEETVSALEMYTQVVHFWTTHNNPRNRGFAIRKIHKWLYELDQAPWGILARTLGASELTAREEEIVEHVRQGLSNREIARLLTVSQRTVEGHLYRIFAKLGISNRSELGIGK